LSAAKIDAETEDFNVPTVGFEFKMALMEARQKLGLSQKQLAEKINVKQSIITDYESGNAIPDPSVISKLNRALNTQLPKPPKKKVVKD
jgi:putative transcription factor